MNEKWESESLRWIHDLRKKSYQKTKGKALEELPVGLSMQAKSLVKKLGLKRAALRSESVPAAKSKTRIKRLSGR